LALACSNEATGRLPPARRQGPGPALTVDGR
jgi:hypothetical protein